MSLENELRQLFGRTEDAPWPGEFDAFDHFLDRRSRRGRALAAAAALALVVVAAAGVLVPRLLPKQLPAVAPPGAVIRVVDSGFELRAPAGWSLGRKLTGTTEAFPGQTKKSVVGVELISQSGTPGATITVTTDRREIDVQGASRRSDGRSFVLGAGGGQRAVGEYAIDWPDYCGQPPFDTCTPAARARVLLVAGATAPGDPRAAREEVLEVMRHIVATVQPITNALRPPPMPTVSPSTKVLLGKGGSGRAAWEAWIQPFDSSSDAGFSVHFPWAEKHIPGRYFSWDSLEPESLQRDGSSTYVACLDWMPRAGRVLVGIAREDVAYVQVQLRGQAPLVLRVFGRDKPVPMVAFASPRLPAASKVTAVIAFDAAGRMIGSAEPYGFVGGCRPRSR